MIPQHQRLASWVNRFAAPAFATLLVGCSGLSQPPLNRSCYALDPGQPTATLSAPREPTTRTDPPTLQVRRLRVDSPYDGVAFVYRTAGDQYQTDYYNNFITPPDQMITSDLTTWLARTSRFAYVVDSGSQASNPYTLTGTVTALYGDYTNKTAPQAVISMRLVLLDQNSRIVFQKQYDAAAPIQIGSAASLVQGWNQALRQILAQSATDLHW